MREFYKPWVEDSYDSDDSLEIGPVPIDDENLRPIDNEADIPEDENVEDSEEDYIPSDSDEDFSDSSDDNVMTSQAGCSGLKNMTTTHDNLENQSSVADIDTDDEEDETTKAIIAAIKKPREQPPEIKVDNFVTDISFHPVEDIIAIATISGDVLMYSYSNQENTKINSLEVHTKACRDIEFSEDGKILYSASKDKSIMLTNVENGKLIQFYDNAHDTAVNKIYIIDEDIFATGDDYGTVKIWDKRTKDSIFSIKKSEDYISCLLTNESKKLLLTTSGDGYLTTINLSARKMYIQSEPYPEELTSMGLFRNNSKLVIGTSKGSLYTFNWGEFGYHCDMFPGMKSPISLLLPLTERIACVAGEEGIIRAAHIAPYRNLGIVGQHSMPIEAMDISNSGEFIASSSHNEDVRFWNVKYFEDFGDIKYNEKHNPHRERQHNLPSSKFSNASEFFADLAE